MSDFCRFCPNNCLMLRKHNDIDTVCVLQCDICKTKYYKNSMSEPITTAQFTYQYYLVTFYLIEESFNLTYYDEPYTCDSILNLDYLPNITPFNIESKLSTILTFL